MAVIALAQHVENPFDAVAEEAMHIAEISADYRQASGGRQRTLFDIITTKVDDLIAKLLANFNETLSPVEAEMVFKEHHPLTASRLKKIPLGAVPLVVLHELLAVYQIPMDRKRLTNWTAFRERYKTAI